MILRSLLSRLYHQGVCARHYLYDKKFLGTKNPPLPTVSIGNVVVGGSGKTQAALLLASSLQDEMKVAILSRGYKGEAETGKEPLCVDITKHGAKLCGDEPWLLASRLKKSLVLVNKDRFKSAVKAKNLGAEMLLLDDGMQHRKLKRDFEIVVIDGNTPLASYLPKGRLREDLGRLKEADLILFIGSPQKVVQEAVFAHTSAPQVVAEIVPEGVFSLDGKELGSIEGQKMGVFCGIGDPLRFVKTIESVGGVVVAAHFARDHQSIGKKALGKFALLSLQRGANFLLCTEKDRVKLLSLQNHHFPLPIAWVKAHLQVVKNQEKWDEALKTIRSLKQRGCPVKGGER